MTASPAHVKQWTDELAADPASTAFLPLARAYRDSGKRDAALRLVLRGLERHPHHVDAHHLLGLLYRDAGDNVRAADEWGIALALAPEHPGARREMGLAAFARGDWASAVKHLEQAQANDVMDQEVRAALESAWQRSRVAARAAPPSSAPAPAPEAPRTEQWDGGRIFDVLAAELGSLSQERGIVGAVMLDAQGFVVAGRMGADATARARSPPSSPAPPARRSARSATSRWVRGRGSWWRRRRPSCAWRPTGDGGMVAVAGRATCPWGGCCGWRRARVNPPSASWPHGRLAVSGYAELLDRVNRVTGVRGSMVVAVEDGLVVAEELMMGVPGDAVARWWPPSSAAPAAPCRPPTSATPPSCRWTARTASSSPPRRRSWATCCWWWWRRAG
jgi:hypothetical protein